MRSLPFKKYQTCEFKSKIIDYRGYSVKICAFYRAVVIMRSLPFKKYQTCEFKSKIIDYRGYSVKICAFSSLISRKYGPIEI